jgi:hypothetical protein
MLCPNKNHLFSLLRTSARGLPCSLVSVYMYLQANPTVATANGTGAGATSNGTAPLSAAAALGVEQATLTASIAGIFERSSGMSTEAVVKLVEGLGLVSDETLPAPGAVPSSTAGGQYRWVLASFLGLPYGPFVSHKPPM